MAVCVEIELSSPPKFPDFVWKVITAIATASRGNAASAAVNEVIEPAHSAWEADPDVMTSEVVLVRPSDLSKNCFLRLRAATAPHTDRCLMTSAIQRM